MNKRILPMKSKHKKPLGLLEGCLNAQQSSAHKNLLLII